MFVIDMITMAIEVMDLVFCDENDNDCVRSNGDGDGSDGHCYRIEVVMHMIKVMAMKMDIVIGLKLQCMR